MLDRRKLPSESYAQYYYEKMALIKACKICGKKAVECLIGGIYEPTVANYARADKLKSPEDLFKYLSTIAEEKLPPDIAIQEEEACLLIDCTKLNNRCTSRSYCTKIRWLNKNLY